MPKICTFLLIILLTSCLFSQKVIFKGKGNLKLQEVDFYELKDWQNGNHKKALLSFIHSCNKFSKMAEETSISTQITKIKVKDFRDVCDIAQVIKTMNSKQAQNFFENWFTPFLVSDKRGNEDGIFTGYYEASLNGSRTKSEKYRYPIYGKPSDLTYDPYLTRAEIENGALLNKNLELFYVDDKVDLFFMHIQGSGRVILENGSEVKVGFLAKNNQPFISIGGYMSENGYLAPDNVNAKTIKKWLKNNPDKMDEIMNINTSFIFFRVSEDENIVGAQGVPLTGGHSLAVDNEIIPYGFPIWVTTYLKNENKTKTPYSDLLISQDTGSAIKGAVRGDIFFGYGKENEEKAYFMASKGQYYILLPNNIVDNIK